MPKNAIEKNKKYGINVWLFAALWIIICIGTALAAFKYPLSGNRGHELKENSSTDEKPNGFVQANNHRRNGERWEWGKTPKLFEGVVGELQSVEYDEESFDEDVLEPIKRLCKLILQGGVDEARKVLPPKFIDKMLEKYGTFAYLLGGEDEAMRILMNRKFDDTIQKTGAIQKVDYNVLNVKKQNNEMLLKLNTDLKELGLDYQTNEAYCVEVVLMVKGDRACIETQRKLDIFKMDGEWFILPKSLGL